MLGENLNEESSSWLREVVTDLEYSMSLYDTPHLTILA